MLWSPPLLPHNIEVAYRRKSLVSIILFTLCFHPTEAGAWVGERICLRILAATLNHFHPPELEIGKSPNGAGRIYWDTENPQDFSYGYPEIFLSELFPTLKAKQGSNAYIPRPSGNALEKARRDWNKVHTGEESLPVGFYEPLDFHPRVADDEYSDMWIEAGKLPAANCQAKDKEGLFYHDQLHIRRSFILPPEITSRHRNAGRLIRDALNRAKKNSREKADLVHLYAVYGVSIEEITDFSYSEAPDGTASYFQLMKKILDRFIRDHPKSALADDLASAARLFDIEVNEITKLYEARRKVLLQKGMMNEGD
jgi:hypothetical protein